MARWPRAGVTALVPVRPIIDRLLHRAARPPVDLRNDPDAYVLVVDLPGVDPAGIELGLTGQVIAVRARPGVRSGETAAASGRWSRRTVARRVTLPGPVDAEAATAHLEAGRLTVRLPKAAPPAPRRIPIQLGGPTVSEAPGAEVVGEAA